MKSKIKFGVSLYSYQDEFFRRSMTLEECIQAVADMGADGIEIIPEEMIRNFPHLSDEFLDQWFGWMEKYGTKPVAIDAFNDERTIYKHMGKEMPFDEVVAYHKSYIDVCHKLGCKYIRGMVTDEKVIRELVPYAEEKNVYLGLEVHAPFGIMSERTQNFLNIKEKIGTKNMGIIPDFGIWEKRGVPVILEQCIRDGAPRACVEFADEKRRAGWSWEKMQEWLDQKKASAIERDAVRRAFCITQDDPQLLRQVMPHILGLHGKFWEMTENLEEASADYETAMRILIEEGFDGYINSEYEGGRHIQDIEEVRGVEQVRRQHAMMRNIIDKIEAEEKD
ncbi:MAG: sugar phosphate isomerase/epimerase [Clostridiales bacterium]|nr:sugar phosphate isomerase/epimerase [Clostridiales bacterium]